EEKKCYGHQKKKKLLAGEGHPVALEAGDAIVDVEVVEIAVLGGGFAQFSRILPEPFRRGDGADSSPGENQQPCFPNSSNCQEDRQHRQKHIDLADLRQTVGRMRRECERKQCPEKKQSEWYRDTRPPERKSGEEQRSDRERQQNLRRRDRNKDCDRSGGREPCTEIFQEGWRNQAVSVSRRRAAQGQR